MRWHSPPVWPHLRLPYYLQVGTRFEPRSWDVDHLSPPSLFPKHKRRLAVTASRILKCAYVSGLALSSHSIIQSLPSSTIGQPSSPRQPAITHFTTNPCRTAFLPIFPPAVPPYFITTSPLLTQSLSFLFDHPTLIYIPVVNPRFTTKTPHLAALPAPRPSLHLSILCASCIGGCCCY